MKDVKKFNFLLPFYTIGDSRKSMLGNITKMCKLFANKGQGCYATQVQLNMFLWPICVEVAFC